MVHGDPPAAILASLLAHLACRFIVTQNRQAVQVQEPAQLASFLELLIGTAGLEEQLAALGAEVVDVAARYDSTEEGMAE